MSPTDLPPTGPDEPRSSGSANEPRFLPGQTLAGRYRVVAAIGRGGMGEVYRADDLTLGQSVALKFLPERLTGDAERLKRLRNEVRVARQVSHPNVCRVYDIVEADGQSFLTMEHIDGEDLASLLRRIGRLPEDKAIELSRQLCAGLAAAHDQGVLHRDLKPANVMIDGRGQVRITDFGLAAVAQEVSGPEARAGTRAYRAPEQAAGQAVTARSDLFCLGLVLFEMLTGQRAFPDGVKVDSEEPSAAPSSLVKGLDPAVERVVFRCLRKNPRERPGSARAVAAALPGGDPLAAAVAAGETPSPELVANAGPEGSLHPLAAGSVLVFILLMLLAVAFTNNQTRLVRLVGLQRPPEDLARDARDVLERLGWKATPRGSVGRLATDSELLGAVCRHDKSAGRWDFLPSGRPALYYFWYRQSPEPLVPVLGPGTVNPGEVTPSNPPMTVPGMARVILDPYGRLLELHVVPRPAADDDPPPPPDWSRALLHEAQLDPGRLHEAAATGVPPVDCDERMAWEGTFPADAHQTEPRITTIRVEAGARQGRPVFFRVAELLTPDGPPREPRGEVSVGPRQGYWAFSVAIRLVVLLGGGVLAWRNWRLKRIDVSGTRRLIVVTTLVYLTNWAISIPWGPALLSQPHLIPGLVGWLLADLGTVWVAYLALEPTVRRRWPWRIVAWNRFLGGRFRDPLVGRDVLIGATAGLAVVWVRAVVRLFGIFLFGQPPLWPYAHEWGDRLTVLEAVQTLVSNVNYALAYAFVMFGLLFLLFLICRREWLAAAITVVVYTCAFLGVVPEASGLVAVYGGLVLVGYAVILTRFGVVAFAVMCYYVFTLMAVPLTIDPDAWYTPASLVAGGFLVAVAVCGFVGSLGGRLLRGGLLLEP